MIFKKKDIMWYIRTITEAVMIFIFGACLIGFITSWFVMIWNKELSNFIMCYSVVLGLVNFAFILSTDKEWRRDYRDESD